MPECTWTTGGSDLLLAYHANEWGRPIYTNDKLFECLALEILQAGLNWQIVLAKRAAFQVAFCQFNPAKIARFNDDDLARMLTNKQLIRNKAKLAAIIHNAKIVAKLNQNDGKANYSSFVKLVWQNQQFKPIIHHPYSASEVLKTCPQSEALEKRLKQAGFKRIGPVTTYSFMQAAGLINDHLIGCFARQK